MNMLSIFQTYLVESLYKLCCGRRNNKPIIKHQIIEDELRAESNWPPTSALESSDVSLAELLKLETVIVDGNADADGDNNVFDVGSDEGGSDCDETVHKEADLGSVRVRRLTSRSSSRKADSVCLLPVDVAT